MDRWQCVENNSAKDEQSSVMVHIFNDLHFIFVVFLTQNKNVLVKNESKTQCQSLHQSRLF